MVSPWLLQYLFLIILIKQVVATHILYVITSSKEFNQDKSDRLQQTVIPVLEASINSLISFGHLVDLYLILGYTLSQSRLDEVRSIIPPSVGLEVWNEATPIFVPGAFKQKGKVRQVAKALSRQHRFVVKDKLMHYDFFVAMEDDMLVHGEHVNYHLGLSRQIEQLWIEAPEQEQLPYGTTLRNITKIFYGNLTRAQVLHLWPGMIRVEVLKEKSESQIKLDEIPVSMPALNLNSSVCCRQKYHAPLPEAIIAWETSAAGVSVREIPGLGWVILLQGPTYDPSIWKSEIGRFYPSQAFNLSRRPISYADPKFAAQSGGWMATQNQLLRLHLDLCNGGFFPPFDSPYFSDDGLWGFNSGVEYWSGGIQLWTERSGCNLQRIIRLEDFSFALLYHTANNKQQSIKRHRRVLVKNMLGQLNSLLIAARKEKLFELSHLS